MQRYPGRHATNQSDQSYEAITFNYSVPVEVVRPKFVLLDAFAHLDARAIAREERVEVELGYFDTPCRPLVRAVVEKGTVTDLVLEPCAGDSHEAPSPELAALAEVARRRIAGGRKPRAWRPVALRTLMRNMSAGVTITTITCTQICFFGICIVCCTTVNEDKVYCGDRVIIHRD